jgi:hypothetical protein
VMLMRTTLGSTSVSRGYVPPRLARPDPRSAACVCSAALPGDLAVAAGPPSASAGLPLRWSRSRAAGSSRRSCDVSLAGWLAAEMNWLGVCQAESMGGSKQRSGHSGSRRPPRRSESEVGKFLRGEPKARETPKASETVDGGDDAVRHELEDFLEQDQAEIAAEYERIYRRSTQDPGTAGDEGEENWAALLRNWLPPSYQVVTKGRIVFPDGTATPQIDALVLRGAYPPRLLDKKLYLSSGVVAAFECKNTLKAHHIKKAAKTAALVKANTYLRRGSLLAELYSPPVYGLLAHSHSWKAESSTPIKNIDVKIAEVLNSIASIGADRHHLRRRSCGVDLDALDGVSLALPRRISGISRKGGCAA